MNSKTANKETSYIVLYYWVGQDLNGKPETYLFEAKDTLTAANKALKAIEQFKKHNEKKFGKEFNLAKHSVIELKSDTYSRYRKAYHTLNKLLKTHPELKEEI